MTDDQLRSAATQRLEKQAAFKRFLLTYVVLSVFFVAIWFFTGYHQYFWPIWPILGLTIGVVFSGFDAYGSRKRAITDADIDAEVRRMRGANGTSPDAN